MNQSKKLLTSKEEIKQYIGGASNHLFKKYVAQGMPARYEDKRWIAHADNIDEFFRQYTKVSMRKMLSKIPEDPPSKKTSSKITHQ